jgi:putative phosphoesterase
MRVAALYDVHGMPWPLEATLREVEAERADLVVFGGDLVDGPFPRRVLQLARAVEARFVRGNCEREPSEWDRAQLDDDELRWLADLPLAQSLDGVLYCHAAPHDDTPLTTARTPDETLVERFGGLEERTVVIGHTHHQFDRRVGDLRVVNAGSVGMPFEGEVASFWALVQDGEPSFRRTSFDVERAVAELSASEWPPAARFVAENLHVAVSREDAIAHFEAAG